MSSFELFIQSAVCTRSHRGHFPGSHTTRQPTTVAHHCDTAALALNGICPSVSALCELEDSTERCSAPAPLGTHSPAPLRPRTCLGMEDDLDARAAAIVPGPAWQGSVAWGPSFDLGQLGVRGVHGLPGPQDAGWTLTSWRAQRNGPAEHHGGGEGAGSLWAAALSWALLC